MKIQPYKVFQNHKLIAQGFTVLNKEAKYITLDKLQLRFLMPIDPPTWKVKFVGLIKLQTVIYSIADALPLDIKDLSVLSKEVRC
jgi:hypothetical protein